MNLDIWCNLLFREEHTAEKALLQSAVGQHRLHLFPQTAAGNSGAARDALLASEIAFGSPDPDVLIESTKLKWIQLFSAGYTEYEREDLRDNFTASGKVFTNSSSVFVEPCAEHILAMMLSNARRFPEAILDQSSGRSWQMQSIRSRSRLLLGQKVLIYGFGTIGNRLAEMLEPFSMEVVGVRREPASSDRVKTVTPDKSDGLLPWADHVINILPANRSTENFFDERRLGLMRPDAVYYSIGRGTTTDSNALIQALGHQRIAAAYLDVTNPEPLPQDHLLWTTPNCHITPHTAGGAADEKLRQVNHFLDNFNRYLSGRHLLDRIL